MTKVSLRGLLLSGLVFFFFSCAKKPNLYTSDEIMQEFEGIYFDFEYLSSRGRIVLEESNGKVTKGTINFRAKKDSVIWFSVTPGLGLEALRGIVTKDYIRIKDRLNGEDINMSFAEMKDRFDLNLSFDLIQNLAFANVPHEFSYRDRLIRIGSNFDLTQVRDGVRYQSKISTSHGKVTELTSNSINDKGGLMASYVTFEDVDGQPFPNNMLFKLILGEGAEAQNTVVHMEISRIERTSTSLNFPFQFN
ncbi:DUF4292 domain-containing protein [Mongoliitalea daihaiensis]|uniref:DUF4292 domain-containing protein n=1 Tax=Mongoliitalea daihaiensis TaxID=2782006 RepID=UPI001F295C68|nr:DUF4292 domain-containing protein [Mongoliitalea daihaiensis]UJP63326.1 DUF4292 domain-containing protein [Mongoliitalea daihaiensis]